MGRLSPIVRALTTTVALVAAVVVVPIVASPFAAATPAPVMQRPADAVSATALPTVQVDGVVWSQAIIGNTVYAAGSFTTATSAATDPVQTSTPRSNLLAYDLATGKLVESFNVPLNGQGMTLTKSPNGSRLYVGGDFTTAGGTTHRRLVAINTATGKVDETFKPNLDARAAAIVATDTLVYVGGNVTAANGVARQRFAAFNASDGSLTGWAPTATGAVKAMTLTPDGSKIIVGGQFQAVNGVNVYGLAAVSPADGTLVPWTASGQVRAYGNTSGITSLRTFGNAVYGTAFTYGPLPISNTREFEGTFSADGTSGNLIWLQDCHGDSYDVYNDGAAGLVYSVSHAHFCGNVGGFTEQAAGDERRALAFTQPATGTLNTNTQSGYKNWGGTPSPTMLNWFPDLNVGTFTGQSQAAWSVTGSGQYVVMGGEFPTVNGAPQRGLVRFATKATATATEGPRAQGSNLVASAASVKPGAVRLKFQASWDRDDSNLTYSIIRNSDKLNPIATPMVPSTFWNRPTIEYTDAGLTPGQSYTYRIYATDPDGNQVQGDLTTVTAAGAGSAYQQRVIADGASLFHRMGESAGPTFFDYVGTGDATASSGVTFNVPGAVLGDANTAAKFSGTSSGFAAGPLTSVTAAGAFTLEGWVRTTSSSGGIILDYGNRNSGNSTSQDRILYLDNTGRLQFSVSNGTRTISSPATYRDGNWHHVAATLSSAGMVLYADGNRVAARTDVTTASTMSGYWRIGGDRNTALTPRPTSGYLNGDIDDVAVYGAALSDAAVLLHYQIATGSTPNTPPLAAFTTSTSALDVALDASGSTDSDGTVASYSWNFGDGSPTASGKNPTHTYASGGAYTVTLTVTDDRGATSSPTSHSVTVAPNQNPVAGFNVAVENLDVSVDGTQSSDPDGTVASYAWAWGDLSPDGSGATATHRFATAGVHQVTLTVTDNHGGTNSLTKTVTTTAPPNAEPVAAFSWTRNGRTVAVNGTGSTDADGSVASHAWDWGDGSPAGSGPTASHTYAADGTFTVTLTVTDDEGATGSDAHQVTISSIVAADAFARVLASGWGSAEIGGAWTLTGGSSKFNTNGQTGQIILSAPASGPTATLNVVSVRDFTGVLDFAVDQPPTGGGVYTTVSTRRVGTSSYQFTLKFLANGSATLAISKSDNGVAGAVAAATTVPGLMYAAGEVVRLKFSVTGTGTTTLAAKAWKVGSPEPEAYLITRTDTAASLQGAGALSIQAYLSGSSTNAPVVASFDNISIAGS